MGTCVAVLITSSILAVGVDVVQAVPASAEPQCAPEDRVWDPQTRKFVCRGGNGPGPQPPGPPAPEPPDGATRTAERIEVCTDTTPGGLECSQDTWGCDFENGEDIITHYERDEVYRTGQGWIPVEGEAGEWRWTHTTCGMPPEDPLPTDGDVWEAVNGFGLPGIEPSIQPPNGRSLVNFATNFYVDESQTVIEPFDLPVGPVTVQIRANATEYRWDFGDGSPVKTTTSPGARYPDLEITHVYTERGTYRPSVTIVYIIEWRMGGGPWQTIARPLEASSSPPVDLQIVESHSRHVDN